MRLEKFITLNEGRSKGIDTDKGIEIISKRCTDAYNEAIKGNLIFRGVTGKRAVMEIDPKKSEERQSRNTFNYYTLFMDNEGTFSKYPKRSESIICSTDTGKAMVYGPNLYVVFPVDGSRIGVVNRGDIFDVSYYSTGTHMGAINTFVDDAIWVYMKYIKEKGYNYSHITRPYDISWSKFSKINDIVGRMNTDRDVRKDLSEILSSYRPTSDVIDMWFYSKDIFGFYKTVMTPERQFQLKKVGDILPSKNEVWTDGYCILVELNTWTNPSFRDKLEASIS